MEKCSKCGNMTAQINLYTGQLICYFRECGYEELQTNIDLQDSGIWYNNIKKIIMRKNKK